MIIYDRQWSSFRVNLEGNNFVSLLSWRRHIGKRQDAGDEVIMCLKSTYLKKAIQFTMRCMLLKSEKFAKVLGSRRKLEFVP